MSAEFPVEPWHVREVGLDLSQLARTESMFALSNGHVGVRGGRAGRLATAAAGLTVRHPGGRPDLDPSRLQEPADRLP